MSTAPTVPYKPFGTVVRDLLIDRAMVTPMGNPNWSSFALQLTTTSYESLRKAVTGEREPSPKIMEEVAAALEVEPSLFSEYQLWLARRAFDPDEVGQEQALSNLARWVG